MGLCFDLGTILEGYADVLYAVNSDVIDHRQPIGIHELRQRFLVTQLIKVTYNQVLAGFPLGNLVVNFDLYALGLIEPDNQRVLTFFRIPSDRGRHGRSS